MCVNYGIPRLILGVEMIISSARFVFRVAGRRARESKTSREAGLFTTSDGHAVRHNFQEPIRLRKSLLLAVGACLFD